MQIQLAIFNITTDVLLADWSTRVMACHVRTGAHGYESCEATLQIPFLEAFLYYQQLGPLKLKVSWGSYRVWEGRLEDPTQFADTSVGLKITAFGGWVAYNDAPYTALWSDTKYNGWLPVLAAQVAGFTPERYNLNTQQQLWFSPQKNATVGGSTSLGGLTYETPDNSSKLISGIQFDYETNLPNTWRLQLVTGTHAFGGRVNIFTVNATGAAPLTGSVHVTFTAADRLEMSIYDTAAAAAFAGENGASYWKLTNLRLVTSTTNRVNTTLGTVIAAGTRTVTPASMVRIYVGQRLFINQQAAGSESVIVTAITATTFTAVFVNAHGAADTVHAHVIYPDEIIKDCVSTLNTLNSTQVASNVGFVQSQAIDIDQAIYEDQYPTEIINQLIAKSDNQTTPRQWVAMVYDNQTLIVQPRGSGTSWYADITSLEVVRTLTQLYNSVYGVYTDVNNKRKLRTTTNTDTDSVTKFGLTRRKAVAIDTSDSTQATKVRDSVLALQLDPIPRATIKLDRIFNKYGNAFKLFFVRADDTLTIRNLPPTLNTTLYDKIRTLVITRTDVDLIADTLSIELEVPLPNLDVQLAQALKGL